MRNCMHRMVMVLVLGLGLASTAFAHAPFRTTTEALVFIALLFLVPSLAMGAVAGIIVLLVRAFKKGNSEQAENT